MQCVLVAGSNEGIGDAAKRGHRQGAQSREVPLIVEDKDDRILFDDNVQGLTEGSFISRKANEAFSRHHGI